MGNCCWGETSDDINEHTFQLNTVIGHNDALQKDNKDLKNKLHERQAKIINLEQDNIRLNNQLNQERYRNSIRPQQIPQPAYTHVNKPVNVPPNLDKERQLANLRDLIKLNEQKRQKLIKQNQDLRSKLSAKQKTAIATDRNTDAFCQGQILKDDEDYKIFLAQTLEKRLRTRIRRTKHICDSHPLNKNNLHEYVDGIFNVLVIVEIEETGYKIAAWTEKAFNQRIQQGDGLIVSLTNRIQFGKLAGKKAINYDETFLIFGNADLRFNNDTKSLYSNFGAATSYYESKGYKVDKLMGKQQRQLKLKAYEIYQLQFE